MTTSADTPITEGHDDPVVVVGAGLSGLRCAVELRAAGVDCVVVDAAGRVGGRVASDEVDGFMLDRGFQVFLTSYPENDCFDLPALELGRFYSGAMIYGPRGLVRVASPLRHFGDSLRSLSKAPFKANDLIALVRLVLSARSRGGESARELLDAVGVSEEAREQFFRPFFSGVLLDPELETPADFFVFLLRMFARGVATLPARGMRAIPEQLAARLPERAVLLGRAVRAVAGNHVELEGGERIQAARVVLATDFTTASTLLGRPIPSSWRRTTTLWFAAEQAPTTEPILVLDGEGDGPVNTLCCPDLASPGYAPPGAHLVCCSIVGEAADQDDARLIDATRDQMKRWFAAEPGVTKGIDDWRLLRTDRITQALPRTFGLAEDPNWIRDAASGVYLCGDYTQTPSINGALASGRRVAQSILGAPR